MRVGHLVGGRFRLQERLGTGSHGEVWRATDRELDRQVALKHTITTSDPASIKRLQRESRLLARVGHPNVVTVHDIVRDGGSWWLVMEFAPGRTLADLGTLPVARVAGIGAQLAAGLEAVHAKGILHHDIKPDNVLITGDIAKLADFGISRVVHDEVTLTGSETVAGTPGYIAPEVADGAPFTEASDVFSLGATLFAALEGESPFGTDNAFALLRKAAAGKVAAPKRAGALAPVLEAMLHVEPERRPALREVRNTLAVLAGELVVEPISASGSRHKRSTMVIAALGVVAIATAAVWVAIGSGDTDPEVPAGEGATAAAETGLIGEQRTADPCALLDPESLRLFGQVELDAETGNFNRCDAMVILADVTMVDVEVGFDPAGEDLPQGTMEMVGDLVVVREPGEKGTCSQAVALPNEGSIYIDVEHYSETLMDVCPMAELATQNVIKVLDQGPVPRRAETPGDQSLFHVDACLLLDAVQLSQIAGIDAANPEVGFGNWSCRWPSGTGGASLMIRFDRDHLLALEAGTPIEVAGHDAFIDPEEDDPACLVSIIHREYSDAYLNPMAEIVTVVVMTDEYSEDLCDQAGQMAELVTASLPAA